MKTQIAVLAGGTALAALLGGGVIAGALNDWQFPWEVRTSATIEQMDDYGWVNLPFDNSVQCGVLVEQQTAECDWDTLVDTRRVGGDDPTEFSETYQVWGTWDMASAHERTADKKAGKAEITHRKYAVAVRERFGDQDSELVMHVQDKNLDRTPQAPIPGEPDYTGPAAD